jgi:transcription elongation factor Elf1
MRLKSQIKNLINKINSLFSMQCPDCNENMTSVLDMEFDTLVYECKHCDKEFI